MAGYGGVRSSYTDTNLIPRSLADTILMLDWQEAPLLTLLGMNAESKFKVINWPSTKVEALEDTMSPFTTIMNESGFDNSETDLIVATGTGIYLRQGDIIAIESEYMLVTAVSTDTLTVVRGYGSTSAVSHDDGKAITILTRAMPEGSDVVLGHTTATTSPYNYSQIISQGVKVTKTDAAIMKYGIKDEMAYQIGKLLKNGNKAGLLPQLLARTFYYGKRVQRTSSAYGSMGGFDTFVTTNAFPLAGATLQKSDIHTVIRQITEAGGSCDLLLTGGWGMEKISAMYENTITTTQDNDRGGSKITTILTPHGEVECVFDWMCPPGYMYFINTDKVGWLTVRPFNTNPISEQGDYYMQDIVGEYTFLVVNEKSHGVISGFSVTG